MNVGTDNPIGDATDDADSDFLMSDNDSDDFSDFVNVSDDDDVYMLDDESKETSAAGSLA